MPTKDRPCGNAPACSSTIYRSNRTGLCRTCLDKQHRVETQAATPGEQVEVDRDRRRLREEAHRYKSLYESTLKTIERQETELGWLARIREGVVSTFCIEPREGSGASEATPVIVASDWHLEELVTLAQTSGLNQFNPEIATERVTRFWQSSLRLLRLLNQDVKMHTVVLALLGDYITNDIHEAESAESNAMLPIQAILDAQEKIIAGLDFLLNHTPYDFVIPCKVGNHSRTTKRVRMSTETGHSLESLMYVNLAARFAGEPRIRFIIDDGYHTYLDVYGKTLRFHHGHAIQYGGGIGGLFIPAYKAVASWSKARRADLDVFGHFHQSKDGGNFICNGSLIGYNAFALRIKADYESPRQTLFLVDKKRGRTAVWPIYLENK